MGSVDRDAERELRDSEEELAAIYENAPISLVLLDGQRRIVRLNHLAGELGGAGPADLFGKRAGDLLRCLNALEDPGGCGEGRSCASCTLQRIVLDTLEHGTAHHHEQVALEVGARGPAHPAYFLVSTARLDLRGRSLVLLSLLDVTDPPRAEKPPVA